VSNAVELATFQQNRNNLIIKKHSISLVKLSTKSTGFELLDGKCEVTGKDVQAKQPPRDINCCSLYTTELYYTAKCLDRYFTMYIFYLLYVFHNCFLNLLKE